MSRTIPSLSEHRKAHPPEWWGLPPGDKHETLTAASYWWSLTPAFCDHTRPPSPVGRFNLGDHPHRVAVRLRAEMSNV